MRRYKHLRHIFKINSWIMLYSKLIKKVITMYQHMSIQLDSFCVPKTHKNILL